MQKYSLQKLLQTLLLLMGTFHLFSAQDARIVTSDGKVIKSSSVRVVKNGTLEYLSSDGKTVLQIAREKYRYAWIPKPADITQADQLNKSMKYEEARTLYKKCGADFKLLGWEPYCIRMEAECLAKTGRKPQAEELLKELRKNRILNPEAAEELSMADDLLCELLIDARKYEEALQILRKQITLDQKDLVFAGLFKMAVILQNTDKRRDAAKAFYHIAILFPDHERRPEALYNAWSLFTELKDPVAGRIAQMLKTQYPEDGYTRRIFL